MRGNQNTKISNTIFSFQLLVAYSLNSKKNPATSFAVDEKVKSLIFQYNFKESLLAQSQV